VQAKNPVFFGTSTYPTSRSLPSHIRSIEPPRYELAPRVRVEGYLDHEDDYDDKSHDD